VRKNWLNLQKQLQIEWLNMLEKLTNFQFYKKQFPRKSTI